ncbi:MAG TPA: tellurite resistance/C4-dicarboxylate transporter family protein [Streptosporangiaceae bacterium]|nr:tellurite resistance/C4-dicarboxylate transporter family protein [Streptosporangiaceae bacterium]
MEGSGGASHRLAPLAAPGSWAVVMGCGIVSADLFTIGQVILSDVLLWFAVAAWLLLAVRLLSSAGLIRQEFKSPAILGGVAGTAVLGARFAVQGDRLAAAVLLGLAALWGAVALVPVLRDWQGPVTGTSFLVSVAISGLAGLSATVALLDEARWLLGVAVVVSAFGLVSYGIIAWRFDRGELGSAAGDHWVAGGALAIATLAVGKITLSATALSAYQDWHGALADLTLALWCVAMAWLVVLIGSEIARPRFRYDVRRWATVFPVGMFGACSFAVGETSGIRGITDFARAWTWVALTVTVVVLAGLARNVIRTVKMV